MKRLVLVPLALLAACGTPQEQCIARETRELRTVERLIAETEQTLQRGYAIETVTVYEDDWVWCDRADPTQRPRLCLEERPVTLDRPKAIDPEAEARKLAGLQQKRAELARAAEPLVAQCRLTYPE